MESTTKHHDVDTTTKQTLNNLTCFVICISICAVALLAQIVNVFLVFHRSAGKCRRIFFYLLLASAILCCLVYVTTCAQLVLAYRTDHSYAWIKDLDNLNNPQYATFWKYYRSLQYAENLSFSLFTVLYILCIQLRFQAIRAIFQYPKWIDYGLCILTIVVWFCAEFLNGVIFYATRPLLGNIMVAIWALYVLVTDNVLSAIFLWKLWKVKKNVLKYSSRHGKISRNIIRGMIGLCTMLWLSLFIFGLNPTIFGDQKNQNLTLVIICFAMSVFPLFFSLGFTWMEAVLQLYSCQPRPKPSATKKISPDGSDNFTLSMKVKASSVGTTDADREMWASVLNEESGCPFDGSGAMVETQHAPIIAQAAE